MEDTRDNVKSFFPFDEAKSIYDRNLFIRSNIRNKGRANKCLKIKKNIRNKGNAYKCPNIKLIFDSK